MVPEINLLPKMESKKSNNLIIILSIILVGALILFLSIQFLSLKKDISTLTTEETKIVAERDVLVAQVSSANTGYQGSLSDSVSFVESVSYPVSPLIEEIHSLLLLNTYLRNYEFGESEIIFDVDFETMNDISIYVEKLLNSEYFTDVQVQEINNFVPPGSTEESAIIDFDIQSRYSAKIKLTIDQTYLSEVPASE
ncbi:hypothetical protein WAX74_07090 [Psychrobacillus sp. FJAT-51614]|uniref:Malate synthase n=1 Tax=Psychrobacillus mangrovi TaxID=3117745 RepID=A0ABU8F322_9BACI